MRSRSRLSSGIVLGLFLSVFAASSGRCEWIVQESGTNVNLLAVQFLDAENGYAVGESGTVLRTSDGGSSWQDVSINTTNPVQALSMISVTTGWAAVGDPNNSDASGAVWHTTDGGMTWSQQPLTSTRARLGISFVSSATGWACGARNGPIDIEATTDGGATWTNQSSSSIFGWTYGIDAASASLAWSCGVAYFPTASGIVIHTTDGGAHWSAQNTGTIPFVYGIDFVDASLGFTAGEQGTILATSDGGASWQAQTTGTAANLAAISFAGAAEGAACGAAGTILTTSDGGADWVLEDTPTSVALNGIFTLDASSAWAVGDGGTILKRGASGMVPPRLVEAFIAGVRSQPDPFTLQTTISYRLLRGGRATIAVHDAAGRRIARLVGQLQSAGMHQVRWNGTDPSGRRVPSGTYYLSLGLDGQAPVSVPLVVIR